MTRRPNLFNQTSLEEALLDLGCPASALSSVVSNYRLFVPLLLSSLSEEQIYDLIAAAREDLNLGEQESAWRSSIKYLCAWGRHEIADYAARRHNQPGPLTLEEPEEQPRLL